MLLKQKRISYLLFPLTFLWQLPQNMVALGVLLCSKNVRKIDFRHGCFVLSANLPKGAGGVSLGNFAFVCPQLAHDEHTIRHEADGHTVDSLIFGPLYLLAIGLPSVLHLIWYNSKRPPASPTTTSTPNDGPTATRDSRSEKRDKF